MVRLAKLSEGIHHRKGFITIDDEREYNRCRVQLHRRGVEIRDTVKGFVINTKKQQVCKEGDFIVAEMDAKFGGYGFIPEQLGGAIVSSHYYLFDVDENVLLREYLRCICKTNVIQNQIKAKGSTNYSAVRPSDVINWEIPLPAISEQKRIIRGIVNTEKELAHLKSGISHQKSLLKKLRQAILQEAVQGKLVPQDPTDKPANELLKRIKAEKEKLIAEGKIRKEKSSLPIKEEEIPFELPKGWVWCRLGDCSINRDEDRIPVARNDRVMKEKIYDYYGASGVIDKIDNYTHDGEYLLIGEDGANLVARSTPVAFIAKGKFWVNNHAHVLKFIDRITLQYIEIFVNAIDLKPYITGGFQPKLSQGNLNNIIIAFPPLAGQERIVQNVNFLFSKCDLLEKQIEENAQHSELLLQAVLKEAFETKTFYETPEPAYRMVAEKK
jgi:restriction endonuclease S subunit